MVGKAPVTATAVSEQKTEKEKSRVPIPLKIQNMLWGRAAGRCEFRGCNKVLYSDGLTKKQDNLAIISHIIAAEPGGPRGNSVDSPRLAKDITNLMLTCRDHGKIIDSKEYEADYPIELLQEYKKEHEDRIRLLTGIQDDAKTHVFIFQAPISGRTFTIDDNEAFSAIVPKYPADEDPIRIDLKVPIKEKKENYWSFMSSMLCDEFDAIFHHKDKKFSHVSVFALAPIPLLVQLGSLLGDKRRVDLHQRHRTTEDWKWKEDSGELHEQYYDVSLPSTHVPNANTAIVVSISGVVDKANVISLLGTDCNYYELTAIAPGLDFLTSRKKLDLFGYEYRGLLEKVRRNNGHQKALHLFCAVPAPVAVECGRALLPKSDPPIMIYDQIKDAGGFQFAFQINACS